MKRMVIVRLDKEVIKNEEYIMLIVKCKIPQLKRKLLQNFTIYESLFSYSL